MHFPFQDFHVPGWCIGWFFTFVYWHYILQSFHRSLLVWGVCFLYFLSKVDISINRHLFFSSWSYVFYFHFLFHYSSYKSNYGIEKCVIKRMVWFGHVLNVPKFACIEIWSLLVCIVLQKIILTIMFGFGFFGMW